jgi:UPF0755 protein
MRCACPVDRRHVPIIIPSRAVPSSLSVPLEPIPLIRLFVQAVKILSIVALTVAIAGGSVWFFDYWTERSTSGLEGRPVTIQITEEDDGASVAEKLSDAELIRYGLYFEQRLRFGGGELRPGTYTLRVGMSVPEILNVVTVPDTGGGDEAAVSNNQPPFQVTFIEGQRIEQNAQVVEEAGLENGAGDYLAAAQNVDQFRGNYAFLESVPRGATLEGFLFPSTYNIGEGATAADVIHYQLSTFESQLEGEMRAQAQELGLTLFEVVTLASIVEREAAIPEERPIIAAVYLNRIEQGMPLQADPVNQYGVGTPDEWWPRLDTQLLEQSKTTPFDTYDQQGMPPGPIANPGFASLQAVLDPADVTFLYFVTTGDESGAHVFSNTLEEHNINICREHPDWEQCQGGGSLIDGIVADRVRLMAAIA